MHQQPDSAVRVAQVVGNVVSGGVDSIVMNYYRHIDRKRIQFDFYMDGLEETPLDEEISSLGGRVFKLPAYTDGVSENLRAFREHLRREDYSIVHCHLNTMSVFWLREAKKAGIPVRIAHNHSTPRWGEGLRSTMKFALKPFSRTYATHYCACSLEAGRGLFGAGAQRHERIDIIHNAIDMNRYAYDPAVRSALRSQNGLEDRFVMGHVGRFVYPKNHGMLLDIFREVRDLVPSALLLLIGDGELRPQIEEKASRLGLRESVLFLGTRQNVFEWMQAMDCLVLPSFYEGLPVVAIEGQAAGLPCFLSENITDEVVITDRNRRLSLEASPRQWAQLIVGGHGGERETDRAAFASHGYDVSVEAGKLAEYYRGILSR